MAKELRAAPGVPPDPAERGEGERASGWQHPAFHAGLLALVTAGCLFISWRKWTDLSADFGRELYTPWRLSEGAQLYRDVDDFYGPLSQYANAVLFKVFGPGLMVLVAANLAVFAAILATLHFVVCAAWDTTTATVASIVFVVVCGFSRAIGTGNFNYATPYSHESTHGMLVLLLLLAVSFRFLRRPSLAGAVGGGGLFGLTLVLKPEFVLAAGAVSAATLALWRARGEGAPWRWAAAWCAGAAAPTLAFVGFFSRQATGTAAWSAAGRAWINVVSTTRYVTEPAQFFYLGLDAPWRHAAEHALAAAFVAGIVGAILLLGRTADRLASRRLHWGVNAGIAAIIGLLTVVFRVQWRECGKCLLGLTLAWLAVQGVRWFRERAEPSRATGARERRLLLGVAAVAMMARMVLNGRVYQFGFVQAALATVVVVAALIGEIPGWKPLGAAGRFTVRFGVGALLASGTTLFALQNIVLYRQIDFAVGEGRDRFFVYGPKIFPQGRVAANVVGELRKLGGDQTLLVLPEGLMLNYLARLRSPLPHFFYYSVVTAGDREGQLVGTLAQRPPDWVIVNNRDLTEYGIAHWGERSGAGKELLEWVSAHYERAGQVDGQPMDLVRDGMVVLRRVRP